MKHVPFLDLRAQYGDIHKDILREIVCVLVSQKFILGENVSQFEEEYADFCGARYAVAVHSGTAALFVALKALGVGKGDEVVTVPNTFIATSEAVTLAGGIVRFTDIDRVTGLIDVSKLEQAITPRTKVIIPVHLFGQIAPMHEILRVARAHTLHVLEDAAQAHGACYKRKNAPIGNLAAYSFYPGKNLGAYGDGGAVVTNNKKIARECRYWLDHGKHPGQKYFHDRECFNFRMDEIQAAVLRVKLRHLDGWVKCRQEIARKYDELFAENRHIVPIRRLAPQQHAYHLYVIRVKKRDKLMVYLKEKGIETLIHYPMPLHLQKAYKYLGYKRGDFLQAEKLAQEILSLPIYPEMHEQDVDYVAQSVLDFYE